MSRRAWFRVHSFAGVFAGLLLFVVCWSGTFATVSAEVDWLLNPALRARDSAASIDWGGAEAAARNSLAGTRVQWIAAPAHAGAAVDVVVNRPDQQYVHVYVDPASSAVLGTTSYFNVQRFFRNLHMALFLPFSLGIYVVGLLAIFLMISVITPLVFYKRWWRRFLQFRKGHDTRALYSELHKLTGLWTLWFVLLIGLTGVWYLVEQLSIDIADARFVYPASPQWHSPQGSRQPLNDLVASALRARPELDVRMVGVEGDLVSVSGQAGDLLVRDRANMLFVDPVNGSIPFRRNADDLGVLTRWVETVDLLHFGNFGGLPTKLLWFVLGVALSGLCLTGAYLHARRLAGVGAKQARWTGRVAALVVTLLVLCATIHGALDGIWKFGPVHSGEQQWPEVPAAVTLFLLAWLASTLAAVALWLRLSIDGSAQSADSREPSAIHEPDLP
jgi:uncharacterized iron-regulated membrane protein